MLFLEKSFLAAIRLALINWLENECNIIFNYYDSTISPTDPPKGGVKVYRITSNNSDAFLLREFSSWQAIIQVRIILATSDPDECESLLLDWQGLLNHKLHSLAFNGLSGFYRGVRLNNACRGIRPSERGSQLATEEITGASGSDFRSWKGLLLSEFEFKYEVDKGQSCY